MLINPVIKVEGTQRRHLTKTCTFCRKYTYTRTQSLTLYLWRILCSYHLKPIIFVCGEHTQEFEKKTNKSLLDFMKLKQIQITKISLFLKCIIYGSVFTITYL